LPYLHVVNIKHLTVTGDINDTVVGLTITTCLSIVSLNELGTILEAEPTRKSDDKGKVNLSRNLLLIRMTLGIVRKTMTGRFSPRLI